MLIHLLAGEASGDRHGAALARELRAREPSVHLAGIGGRHMRDAGVEILQDMTDLATTGIVEVLGKLPRFRALLRRLTDDIERRRPDALVTIDFPDFNLRVAQCARAHVRRLFYYIGPQAWAWREGRAGAIRKLYDKLLVIFPFEEAFWSAKGVPCSFVGHPLLDDADLASARGAAEREHPPGQVLALLPGSRLGEFRRLWPVFREAARIVRREEPGVDCLLAPGDGVPEALVRREAERAGFPLRQMPGDGRAAMAGATVTLVASGTATLEAALLEAPHVVAYRVHPASAFLLRGLLRVDTYAMSNLLARHAGVSPLPVPEFVQGRARPDAIAAAALYLLRSPSERARQISAFGRVRASLGEGGASGRAADLILASVRSG